MDNATQDPRTEDGTMGKKRFGGLPKFGMRTGRGPGRPRKDENREAKGATAPAPATHAPGPDDGRGVPTGTPGDTIPYESKFTAPRQKVRKNGSTVPLIVQKIVSAKEDSRRDFADIEKDCGLHENKMYIWRHTSGQPNVEQALRLADYFDMSLEYLIDDTVEVRSPYPRRLDSPARRLLETAKHNDLSIDWIERYMGCLATASQLGIWPAELHKLLVEIAAQRVNSSPVTPPSGGYVSSNAPTVREALAAREAQDAARRRGRGGPKPKTG